MEFYNELKQYFKNTPKEILDKDWKDIKHLNNIGPDVIKWANKIYNYGNILYFI